MPVEIRSQKSIYALSAYIYKSNLGPRLMLACFGQLKFFYGLQAFTCLFVPTKIHKNRRENFPMGYIYIVFGGYIFLCCFYINILKIACVILVNISFVSYFKILKYIKYLILWYLLSKLIHLLSIQEYESNFMRGLVIL